MDTEKIFRDPHSHIQIKADTHPATVKVVSDETSLGYMIINESDFDKKVHKRYVEKE
jgi:hypothetical protein